SLPPRAHGGWSGSSCGRYTRSQATSLAPADQAAGGNGRRSHLTVKMGAAGHARRPGARHQARLPVSARRTKPGRRRPMSRATAVAAPRADEFFAATLAERDPEVFGAIGEELGRQQHQIELIASENIVSRAVLEAQGSALTNKYAEGYPGRRYYGGCEF